MIVLSHEEALAALMRKRNFRPRYTMTLPKPIPVAASDLPGRVAEAVAHIRLITKRADKFPDDFGCETQLYLGLAARQAFPNAGFSRIAEVAKVDQPDAVFFGTLLDIAIVAPWVDDSIVDAAARILRGRK